MKTINQQLSYLKTKKKIGLMTHVVIGYPTLKETYRIILDMQKVGVDFIELQIPFSDPLADGPTIMYANDIAIRQNITLKDCFELMHSLSKKVHIPLLLMSYYQSVFHFGVDRFCRKASEVGMQGIIVPDMPIDEEPIEHFIESCNRYHLPNIRLLSPTSTVERIKLNAKVQNGFVYCTSRNGTTGSHKGFDVELQGYLDAVKKYITVPIALGFGISSPEHIRYLAGKVDIAVVGSATIERIRREGINSALEFVKELVSETLLEG